MAPNTSPPVVCYVGPPPAWCYGVVDALEETGLEVVTTTTVDEARSTLDERAVDCVLCEHCPPEVDGLALLEAVSEAHDVPVVLQATDGSEALASAAIRAGVTDYVPGDADHDELANRVAGAVDALGRGTGPARDPGESQRLLDALTAAFPDSVYVYDDEGTYLDALLGHRRLAINTREELLGRTVHDVLPAGAADAVLETVRATLETGTLGTVEYSLSGAEKRWFEGVTAPIDDGYRGQPAVVLSVHDVTERKRRERELARRERQVDLMRQVLSRVLRHNIRNDLTVVRAYSASLRDQLDGEQADLAGRVISTADDLLSISEKARTAERLIDRDRVPETLDLAARLREMVSAYREAFPHVSFELSASETCPVETLPMVEVVLENLIENAAQHNDAADPRVGVDLVETAAGPRVTVADNGPGIPDHELAVLEQGRETALEHGSGIGLWLVDWIADHSAASISFDTGPGGTVVTVVVPDQSG